MKIDLKNKTGVITLESGHSMYSNNRPEVITNEMFSSIIPKIFESTNKEDIENLGLFDNSTPNYTTYYPDVSPEDLMPKETDFIYPIFRCLSATVVWKGYKPIDFSKPGVLKSAMKMLVGQTINVDHETALGNGIGVVKSVAWNESYTVDGVVVPAGINGEFMIDGKSNPRLARGMMMKPPSIHSNSVSVRFEWEPSHKLKSDDEFYSKLGSRDADGNLYRLIVTKIQQFTETSLVAHGADPFAQIVNDGQINNAKYANGVYNFSATDATGNEVKAYHQFDYKSDLTVDLSQDTIPNKLNNNFNTNENEESMELIKQLETILGLSEDSLKDADQAKLSEAITNFSTSAVTVATSELETKLQTAQDENATLTTDKETLTQEVAALKIKEAVALKYEGILEAKRVEAKRLYQLSKGEDAKADISAMLDTCEESILDSLSSDYLKEAELKYPSSCKKCGSHEINKASFQNEGNFQSDKGGKNQTKTAAREDLRKVARENNKKK